MSQIRYVVKNNLNIHSNYCKLNDYKGASCGQHSALSTQHSALSFKAFLKLIVSALFFSFSNIATAQLACKYNLDEVIYPSPIAACEGFQDRVLKKQYIGVSGSRVEFGGLQDIVRTNFTGFGLPDTYYLTTVCYLRQYSSSSDLLGNGHSLWVTCNCTEGYRMNQQGGCESPDTPVLTLTPAPNQKDPRPKGTEGKDPKSSTYELIAKVMEGSTPKAGVAVTFKVDVIEKTGGHGHHDANRPKGSVPASGVTDANGEIKLTFQATEVAGSHNITATCDSCSNKTAVKKVDVLVPNLAPISPNPSRNADGSYQYAFTAVDPGHVGTSGGRQRGEYYLTEEATANLNELIKQFAKEGWGIVALNDASLNWGGVYDLNNNWRPPHSTHRKGEDIDISFTRAGNPISKKKQSEFYDKFCEDKKISIPFTILHHYQAIPHFHVYLMGQKQCAKTPN